MDVLHDNSFRTLAQLDQRCSIPSYVTDYDLPTKEASDGMRASEFADTYRRLYPIGSPALTWLSAAYFAKNASEVYSPDEASYVRDQIKRAASIYGIAEDVDKALSVWDQETKQASDEDVYAFVKRDAAGNVLERGFPIVDANGVKLACDYFAAYRAEYTFDERQQIAANIIKKAEAFGTQVNGTVLREAGKGIPSKELIMGEILYRAQKAANTEIGVKLAEVNEALDSATTEELIENLDKIAAMIDDFDAAAGLRGEYGKSLLMPADVVYSLDVKAAEEWESDAVELDKYVFSLKKLAELPLAAYHEVLGPDFAESVKSADNKVDLGKLSDNLFSLPRPDKMALEDFLVTTFT